MLWHEQSQPACVDVQALGVRAQGRFLLPLNTAHLIRSDVSTASLHLSNRKLPLIEESAVFARQLRDVDFAHLVCVSSKPVRNVTVYVAVENIIGSGVAFKLTTNAFAFEPVENRLIGKSNKRVHLTF